MNSPLPACIAKGALALFPLIETAQAQQPSPTPGRYTLTSSHTTHGIFRLDTVTGAIVWCHPSGNEKNGYRLVCMPEVRPTK
jgi:hypothetical protein